MTERPPLATSQFDRAALRRGDDGWLSAAWHDSRVVVISARSTLPVSNGAVVYADPHAVPDGPRRFLGIADGVAYFTVTLPAEDDWQTLREFGPDASELEASLLVSAVALEQWHQKHAFCPRCGAPTAETQAGWTRTCTQEGSVHFPRTDPAVIMLIMDGSPGGDKALLGRGKQWASGRFSTLAGFVEPGESLESAVAREVFEEVGVGVRDMRYVASQPWPFPASLMLGFTARLDGDSSITLDPVEMAEAGWFTRDEVRVAADWTDNSATAPNGTARLRAIPHRFSISRFLIDRWLAGDV